MCPRYRIKLLLALFALAAGATAARARPPLPQPKGYDLRGPALAKGMVLTIKTSTEAKDNEMTVDGDGGTTKVTTKVTGEQQVELLAVEGRNVTRLRTRVGKLDVSSTTDGESETYKAPLSGKILVSELVKGQWTHTRHEGDKAIAVTAADRAQFRLWTPDDQLYPAKRVPVGHTWELGPKDFLAPPGAGWQINKPAGKAKCRFRAVETYQGEPCAVVDVDLTLRGEAAGSGLGDEMSVKFAMKVTLYRSLKTGLNLKRVAESDGEYKSLGGTLRGKERTEVLVTLKKK